MMIQTHTYEENYERDDESHVYSDGYGHGDGEVDEKFSYGRYISENGFGMGDLNRWENGDGVGSPLINAQLYEESFFVVT